MVVTKPLESIVATEGSEEIQGVVVAAVADPVNCKVGVEIHAVKFPVIVGNALTITDAVILHPLELVYVIIVVPALTPVTTPAVLTVATEVFEAPHGLVAAGVPDPVNALVEPTQILTVPVIVGNALTVSVAVILQPLELV